jgi:CheY-like chemotaxis protein
MKDGNAGDQKTLLLIDDDPNLILLVKDYLEFRGYSVITAENGREALDILNGNNPDMIICDVMMPEMDGYAFVEHVRSNPETEWIPVLFLSAKGQSQDRVKGLNTGADVYMVKPFEPEELVAQVESSLKQASRLIRQQVRGASSAPTISVPFDVELNSKWCNSLPEAWLTEKLLMNCRSAREPSKVTLVICWARPDCTTGLSWLAGRSKIIKPNFSGFFASP